MVFSVLNDSPGKQGPAASWAPVYIGLRDAIVSHKIDPGTKLPEDEIASIYGVSRTLVRSALQALRHDRLIDQEPNRGAFVAQPSKREAQEVFEARALIEPHVAFLAAGNGSPEAVAHLRRHLEHEHQVTHAGSESEAIIVSARFHEAIAELAGQAILSAMVKDLLLRSSLIVALYWRRRDTTCESHAHTALVDAIERKDGPAAHDLMKSHLVDLLSGLDLSPKDKAGNAGLASILRP